MPSIPEVRPKNAPATFHVLGKPSGATCNLNCTYCFFLSKEKLYPDSRFRMPDELLEAYICQLLESQRGTSVTIAWQGREGLCADVRRGTGFLVWRTTCALHLFGDLRQCVGIRA